MTDQQALTIRSARPDDAALILEFIRELADYERMLDEVSADETAIHDTLFTTPPSAQVFIAEWDNKPVGFALFHGMYSTFMGKPGIYLEDLYVRPAARGRGIGTALLRRLARYALDTGCGRLDWSCLDWNEPSLAFYRKIGARELTEWVRLRVDGDALTELAGTQTERSERSGP